MVISLLDMSAARLSWTMGFLTGIGNSAFELNHWSSANSDGGKPSKVKE